VSREAAAATDCRGSQLREAWGVEIGVTSSASSGQLVGSEHSGVISVEAPFKKEATSPAKITNLTRTGGGGHGACADRTNGIFGAAPLSAPSECRKTAPASERR
jgi:hypothetical protein